LNSLTGPIFCLPEYMSVYRIHGTSSWSANLSSIHGKIKTTEWKLELFLALRDHLPEKWQPVITSQINVFTKIIEIYSRMNQGKWIGMNSCLWLALNSLKGNSDSRVCLRKLIKTTISF